MAMPIGSIGLPAQGIGTQGIGGDSAGRLVPIGKPEKGASFGEMLTKALSQVSEAQDTAADYIGKFTRGEPVEIHQVTAAAEEAGIALELLVEVRNKLTDAYRAVVNMQG